MPEVLCTNTEIAGLDRASGSKSAVSDWVELLITRKSCTPSDAYAILNLLLTGIINETTGEKGKINEYASGSRAELMNLPADVLDLIPMTDPHLKNDDQGSKPLELHEYLAHLVSVAFMLLAAFGEFLAKLINSAVKAGLEAVMTIAKAVMAAIEAMMKAGILAYVYYLFAQILEYIIKAFVIIAGFLLILKTFADIVFNISYNKIEASGDINISLNFDIKTDYYEFLDIDVPLLEISFFLFDFGFKYAASFHYEQIELINFPSINRDFFEEFFGISGESNNLTGGNNALRISSDNAGESANNAPLGTPIDAITLITGFGTALGLAGGFVSLISGLITLKAQRKHYLSEPLIKKIEIATYIAFLGSIIIFIVKCFEELNFWEAIGLACGFIFAGLAFILISQYIRKYRNIQNWFQKKIADKKLYQILYEFDIYGNIIGFFIDLESLFGVLEEEFDELYDTSMAIWALTTGGIALFLATGSLIQFGGYDPNSYPARNLSGYTNKDRTKISLGFGIGSIIIGLIFIWIALLINDEKNIDKK
ncbi:MAG: hypothetical protein ACP6IY_05430 [Promethearchaeia archaeon]